MKWIAIIWVAAFCGMAGAQPIRDRVNQQVEEVKETLRFIRLAETKKNLSFSEEKLLMVNEMADRFEEIRFDNRAKERRLRMRLRRAQTTGEDGTAIIDELMSLRTSDLEAEKAFWAEIRDNLTPTEAVAFYAFYERFQREVQRRVRQLQGQRRNDRGDQQP